MKKRIIGIDFGTSTTVVRVKRYEEDGTPVGDRLFVSNVLFDGRDSVPTLIQIPEDIVIQEDLALNEADCEFGYYAAAEQPGMKSCRNFKVELESPDQEIRRRARWLTRQFMAYLYRGYSQQTNQLGDSSDEEITYISYPAKYNDENKEFMIKSAQDAGFRNVRGITEPEAAVKAVMVQDEKDLSAGGRLAENKGSYLLFIDMGAGTTDIAVCKYEHGRTQIIATWPDKKNDIYFGGKDIDEILCGYVKDYLRQNAQIVPEHFIESFTEKYLDNIKAWKEITVSRTLMRGKSIPYFQTVKNPYPALPDFSPAIDRTEFERACADYLKNFAVLVNGSLEHAKAAAPDFPGGQAIDMVILSGGHSQWYFIQDILTGRAPQLGEVCLPKIRMNPDRLQMIGKPQETVAVGMVYGPMISDFSIQKRSPGNETDGTDRIPGTRTAAYPDERKIASAEELFEQGIKSTKPEEKIRCFIAAAEGGVPGAQCRLASFYEKGYGSISKDRQLAIKWYQKAKEGGDQSASVRLRQLELEDEMTKNSAAIPADTESVYTFNEMISRMPLELTAIINSNRFYEGFAYNYYKNHYADIAVWLKKAKVTLLPNEYPVLYLNTKGSGKENPLYLALIFTNKRILSKSDPVSGFGNPNYMTGHRQIFYRDILDINCKKAAFYKCFYTVTFQHYEISGTVRQARKSSIAVNYPELDYIPIDQFFRIMWKYFS